MNRAARWSLALVVLASLGDGMQAAQAVQAPDPFESAKVALRNRSYPAALASLQSSAGAGNAQAQLLLGLINLNGVGTNVDPVAAENWLTKSAAQNNATAAYVLAALYARRGSAESDQAWRYCAKLRHLDIRPRRKTCGPDACHSVQNGPG